MIPLNSVVKTRLGLRGKGIDVKRGEDERTCSKGRIGVKWKKDRCEAKEGSTWSEGRIDVKRRKDRREAKEGLMWSEGRTGRRGNTTLRNHYRIPKGKERKKTEDGLTNLNLYPKCLPSKPGMLLVNKPPGRLPGARLIAPQLQRRQNIEICKDKEWYNTFSSHYLICIWKEIKVEKHAKVRNMSGETLNDTQANLNQLNLKRISFTK